MSGKDIDTSPTWRPEDIISESMHIENCLVRNIIRLLNEDCTIPFIARYRKEQTNDMAVEKLREVQSLYEELKEVERRIASVMKSIEKVGKLTKDVSRALKNAHTANAVEQLYAPFKPGGKRSLADRARELGLESLAQQFIDGKGTHEAVKMAINKEKEGLATYDAVISGIEHIISDIISKDKCTMDCIRQLCNSRDIFLVTKVKTPAKTDKETGKKTKTNKDKGKAKSKTKVSDVKKSVDASKFQLYFDFSSSLARMKPHQVMAINRGEAQNVLSVKVDIPDRIKGSILKFCQKKWVRNDCVKMCRDVLNNSVDRAYKKLIEPLLIRQFRADLTKTAKKASIDVFASNLRRLLLTPPIRGHTVLGVDPGFSHGCKVAVTSPSGQVLHTDTLYIHGGYKLTDHETDRLQNIVKRYRCDLIAIGNGTACRETETYIADLIQKNAFHPVNVSYCIVSESGASIYSVSDTAQKEMPDLDQNLRSAVSIARRLQDPLSELVKIEPQHIGVGQYQHDVPEKEMQTSLDNVVEDCVSFVGVDLNFSTPHLLRRVAGLSENMAKKILSWREKNGSFTNREQLNSIKGLGPKTFTQCAGFLKILPESLGSDVPVKNEESEELEVPGKKRKLKTSSGPPSKKAKVTNVAMNKLDMTIIHPESYDVTYRILKKFNLDEANIGKEKVHDDVRQAAKNVALEKFSQELGKGIPTIKFILEALQNPIGHDIREEFEKPLFKKGTTSINDLKEQSVLTGRVTNVTHFGAFVDIGIQTDGLIHTSQMKNLRGAVLQLGDRVKVCVLNVDQMRMRISLRLESILSH